VAIAEVGAIAERRIAMLIDSAVSRLPPFLTGEADCIRLHGGSRYAAALGERETNRWRTGERRLAADLGQPGGSRFKACFAARRLQAMISNTAHILGIELLAAAQGIEFLRPLRRLVRAGAGARTGARRVPAAASGPPLADDIERATAPCDRRRVCRACFTHCEPGSAFGL